MVRALVEVRCTSCSSGPCYLRGIALCLSEAVGSGTLSYVKPWHLAKLWQCTLLSAADARLHTDSSLCRYGQAFSATEYMALWDDSTDYIKLYDDGFYGTRLKAWGFDPLVKAHSTDFKIAAFKPANWLK